MISPPKELAHLANSILQERRLAVWKQTDRMFACLMAFQFIAGIAAALWVSPRAWVGLSSHTHPHVWAAIILGGLLVSLPVYLACVFPGRAVTRHTIAVSQMLYAALLIHLMGGRIETHFHIFGSLAFLAFYRDWPVLLTATVVVVADHLTRGLFWPQSVFGVLTSSTLRVFEHGGWVVFEDLFLFWSCWSSTEEMRRIAEQQAELELTDIQVRAQAAELMAANEELIRASRFTSEFLATMSHELRTPLNGVLGMNELLLKTPLTPKQIEFVEASSTSGTALLSLVNDVLDISKIESGKLELDPRSCDLEALVYDVINVFSYKAKQQNVSLSCRLEPETCVTVSCDDNRLRQILVNLLGNALKFTATGSVTFESKCVQRDDHRIVVLLVVTDTGLGIPENKLDSLFSPFSQVDRSTSRQFGGTGLGLSISRQLVELMGGTIGVTSRLGVGSTFWVEIPFEYVESDLMNVRRRQLLDGRNVLVVSGSDKERGHIIDCLETWKCSHRQVGTVHEAVGAVSQAKAEGHPFELVLADCNVAGEHDYLHLQQLAKNSDLPVIGLGIGQRDGQAAHLYRLGLRHLLSDPVRPSTLFNTFASVLAVSPSTSPPREESDVAADEPATAFSSHILVAEDNLINQMFVRELLKHSGCSCDIANNGDEALIALQERSYDLVLMDGQMPEMDGFTATREIRRLEAASQLAVRLPIVALTANALKGDRERCLEAGMDDYLTKPLQHAHLAAILSKYLTPSLSNTPLATEKCSTGVPLPSTARAENAMPKNLEIAFCSGPPSLSRQASYNG